MKNINMKKVVAGVAALGISAMFAGAVVAANVTDATWQAPNALTKADLFSNGVPAYNIVLGSMAMPVDVVWAGNIAAAIGKKAYVTSTSTGGAVLGDVTIEVGSESTSTISGDGKLLDDYEVGAERVETIDKDDYTLLKDYDVKVDDNKFNDDTENVKDTITVTSTIAFDSDKDVADLTATINKKDIDYTIEFTPALKDEADDTGSPDMKFYLMGKQYTVEDWDGTTLKLVQNKATTPYTVGATFEVDGYTIEVLEILESTSTGSTYNAEMSISKDGVVLATEVYADGETIFDDYLSIDTEIDTVYNSRVTIVSGTSAKLSLKNGTVIKDFPNIDDELWYSDFTTGGVAQELATINIYNNDTDLQWKNEDALKVGDKVTLPNDFAEIEFLGLTTESSKTVTVQDNVLSYTDNSDDDHDLFLYEEETGTYADGDTYTTSQELDGKQMYITFDTTDADLTGAAVGGDAGSKGYFTMQLEDEDGKFLDYDGSDWAWVSGAADATNKLITNLHK
jgi:hypothetical protein